IAFAIPPAELTAMLRGRAAGIALRPTKVENGVAELQAQIRLIDPLNKVKSVGLCIARADALKEPLKAKADGTWPELPGADKFELKMDQGKAAASVTLKSSDKLVAYSVQAAIVDGDGKTVFSEVLPFRLDYSKGVAVGNPPDGGGDTRTTVPPTEVA